MAAITWLSGASNDTIRAYAADHPEIGLLVTPDTARYVAHRVSYSTMGATFGEAYGRTDDGHEEVQP